MSVLEHWDKIHWGDPINRDHPLNAGLVSWWMYTPAHPIGARFPDLYGLNHGTNGANVTPGLYSERPGLSFSGSGISRTVATRSVDQSVPLTFAASIRPASIGLIGTIIGWGTNGGLSFRFESTGALRFVKQFIADIGSGTTGTVNTNNWQRVVGSYNPSSGVFNFWRNGVDAGSGSNAQTLVSGVPQFGARASTSEPFIGQMHDVQIRRGVYWTDEMAREDYQQYLRGYPDMLRTRPRKSYFAFTIPVYSEIGSGGVLIGGASADNLVASQIAAGGIVLGGASAVQRVTDETASGSVVIAGSAPPSLAISFAGSGGINLTGATSQSLAASVVASGGIAISGEASHLQEMQESASGGVSIAGAASHAVSASLVATGGIDISGTADASRVASIVASGAIVVSGSAAAQRVMQETGDGGTSITGNAVQSLVIDVIASGGVVLSGDAIVAGAAQPIAVEGWDAALRSAVWVADPRETIVDAPYR